MLESEIKFLSQNQFEASSKSTDRKREQKPKPLDPFVYIGESLVTTKIIKQNSLDKSKIGTSCLSLLSKQSPRFNIGGWEATLAGKHTFLELETDYGEEKEIISLRLAGWSPAEAEILFSKFKEMGKVENQAINFNKNSIDLSTISQTIAGVVNMEDDPSPKYELIRQINEVGRSQNISHFDKDGVKLDYRLSDDDELVVFDEKVNNFVKVKHTSSDPEIVAMLEEVELRLASSSGPIRIIYTGCLSARTKGEREKNSDTVVSIFEKNLQGKISFKSDLPPDDDNLVKLLAEQGAEEWQVRQILQNQNQIISITQSSNKQFDSKFNLKRDRVNYPNFSGGYSSTLFKSFDKTLSEPKFGSKNFELPLPIPKFNLIDNQNNEEDEEEQVANGILLMANRNSSRLKNLDQLKDRERKINISRKVIDLVSYRRKKDNQVKDGVESLEKRPINKIIPIKLGKITKNEKLMSAKSAKFTKQKAKVISLKGYLKDKAQKQKTLVTIPRAEVNKIRQVTPMVKVAA